MAVRPYDGYAILFTEACDRLEAAGWTAEVADDGVDLRNGRLVGHLDSVDSLGSLMSADEVDAEVWRLRRAVHMRKRP